MVRPRHWAANWWTYSFWISEFFFFFNLCFRRRIERSTLMGMEREIIVSTVFRPFGLTVNGQYIYWTDWSTKKIYRANKYDGSGQTAMTTSFPFWLMGIRVVVKDHPQQCSNPCDQFNGGCSHICAPGKALPMNIESRRVIMMMATGRDGEGIFCSNRTKSKFFLISGQLKKDLGVFMCRETL